MTKFRAFGQLLVICATPLMFASSCDAQQTSKPSLNEHFEQSHRSAMSETTQHVLTTQRNFCDAVSAKGFENRRLDTHAFPAKALNDLTIQAICLDGNIRGDYGFDLAMDTALIAQTVDESFEHQATLYSMIVTSPKASWAEKAWASHTLAAKGLPLVKKARSIQSIGSQMGGYYSYKKIFMAEEHKKLGR